VTRPDTLSDAVQVLLLVLEVEDQTFETAVAR
jgi:hypothetical protein